MDTKTDHPLTWTCKKFHDLSVDELYAIIQLRTNVFAVEQKAVYQDLDGKDQPAWHLMGRENDRLVAYCRLIPAGVAFTEASIGRVVTALSHRGNGTGRELMERAIGLCKHYYGDGAIKIGAQYYLLRFYSSFGFEPVGEIYMEDGIQHIHMVRPVRDNVRQ